MRTLPAAVQDSRSQPRRNRPGNVTSGVVGLVIGVRVARTHVITVAWFRVEPAEFGILHDLPVAVAAPSTREVLAIDATNDPHTFMEHVLRLNRAESIGPSSRSGVTR